MLKNIFPQWEKVAKCNLRASKNTNSVFSATKQIMRMRGHRCSKNIFLSEKKLLNAILRAKLKHMKNVSF